MVRLFLLLVLLAAVPALAQTRPDPKRVEIDQMLDQLRTAPSEQASAALEARIEQAWAAQAGPAAALLLNRSQRNAQNNADSDALDDIDAALTLAPDYAEAFVRRARVRASVGEYRAAIADIEAALQREKRHFGAWKALSRIAEDHGDIDGALRAWERALEIAPRTPYGADRLLELRQKAEGEGT
jgi:tetratricopeptide (TPR) repeat protein